MPYRPRPKPERKLLHQLWAMSRLLFHTLDKTSGIAALQQMVLRHIGRFPTVSPGTVAGELRLPPSVLAGTLVELEQRRLVRRSPDPRDGRRAMLGLTPVGRETLLKEAAELDARLRDALAAFSGEELETFQRVLDGLVAAVDIEPSGEPVDAPAASERRGT